MKTEVLIIILLAFSMLFLCSCEQIFGENTDVIFDPQNGEAVRTFTVKKFSDINIPSDPTRSGYSFDGWYFDNGVWQEPFSMTALEDKDKGGEIRIYAKWNADESLEYTVKYYCFGELYASRTAIAAELTDPEPPKRDGYTFGGWYLDADLSTPFNSDALVPENSVKPISVYAQMIRDEIKDITVNFYIGVNLYVTVVSDGATINMPATPDQQNYVFLGWYSDPEFNNRFDIENVDPAGGDSTNAYAKMARKEDLKIELLLYSEGELYARVKTDGKYFNMPPEPKKENNDFLGWYYDEAFNYRFNESDSIEKTTPLYARFAGSSIIVTQRNGDSIDSCKIRYGEDFRIPTGIIPGNTEKRRFIGWALDETGELITDSYGYCLAPSTFTENISVKAVFEDYAYTVTLIDEESTEVYYVFADGKLPRYSEPSKSYHDFLGWYTAQEGGERIDLSLEYEVKCDLTLTALYKEHEKVIYHFDYDGAHSSYSDTPCEGSTVEKYVTQYNHSAYIPSDFYSLEKTGYTYEYKWICVETGDTYYSGNRIEFPAGEYHLKPMFTPIAYYIIYDYPEYGAKETESYTYDEVITLSEGKYSSVGWLFSYWEDKSTGNKYYKDHTVTGLAVENGSKITLTACYRPIEFSVTLKSGTEADARETIVTMSYGTYLINPFYKEGYTVDYWYDEATGEPIEESIGTCVTEDGGHRTLIASWRKITYKLILQSELYYVDTDKDKSESKVILEYDEEFTLPEKYTKPGYKHIGWHKNGYPETVYPVGTTVKNLTDEDEDWVYYSAVFVGINYTLIINANDGSGKTNEVSMTYGGFFDIEFSWLDERENYTPRALYVEGYGVRFNTLPSLTTVEDSILYADVIWLYDYEGKGESYDPFIVKDAEGFAAMYMAAAYCSHNPYFIVAADIDMTGMDFKPLDYYGTVSGQLMGNGHVITGLQLSGNISINGSPSILSGSNPNMMIMGLEYIDPVYNSEEDQEG